MHCFTVSDFLALVERERDWFEVLMAVGLRLGASLSYNVRMILFERSTWLRN